MDFNKYTPKKGDFFNKIFRRLPVHLKQEMRQTLRLKEVNSEQLTFKLMILNWAAVLTKQRLTETQLYEERDKILNQDTHTEAEQHNQEHASLAYTWAILYRRFLDKKIAAQHTDIISMASRDMVKLATRIRNGLRR
ncbi:MAG: hypothetical protein IKV03_06805 [Alphaproteobacteria bacterium]|nr:hypothetical protein [Alphaproteobacteria bacterium]MBR5130907.1 hypothetical protein [Alphaproteobacteria bacterium]